eukprot:CAMPEP_0196683852 /NCGR_PEP_ID=MMETSP1090-20130531/10168_1 /TAXON_ID=37098 /ORGANISM="Isochrysis sp, Strain CCMP1244" /LENGTH=331 /DNA_ID=CAMNT_0042022301 /DNA_START=337 /DNA_END=1333 /DNA_ORIENTATION=-
MDRHIRPRGRVSRAQRASFRSGLVGGESSQSHVLVAASPSARRPSTNRRRHRTAGGRSGVAVEQAAVPQERRIVWRPLEREVDLEGELVDGGEEERVVGHRVGVQRVLAALAIHLEHCQWRRRRIDATAAASSRHPPPDSLRRPDRSAELSAARRAQAVGWAIAPAYQHLEIAGEDSLVREPLSGREPSQEGRTNSPPARTNPRLRQQRSEAAVRPHARRGARPAHQARRARRRRPGLEEDVRAEARRVAHRWIARHHAASRPVGELELEPVVTLHPVAHNCARAGLVLCMAEHVDAVAPAVPTANPHPLARRQTSLLPAQPQVDGLAGGA